MTSLRHTLRRLAQSPSFTLIAILTLALGIGANASIFALIHGVLLKPLPYPEADRLISLRMTAPGVKMDDLPMAPYLYFLLNAEARAFEGTNLWSATSLSVTGLGQPEEVPGLAVTHQLLPLLGARPAAGRLFLPADEDDKNPRVALITHAYWQSQFQGKASALGQRPILDGDAHEIVGVLPPNFDFLDRRFSYVMPYRFNRAEIRLGNFSHQGIARLKPGRTLADANADLARLLPIGLERFPAPRGFSVRQFEDARVAPRIRFLKDDLIGSLGGTLWVLMGTVGIVLLIACANIANLLLVRAGGRQQEFAVRAALGAGWGSIARELLTESLLLGLGGGLLGLAIAWGALRLLVASDLSGFPRLRSLGIDPIVVAFTLGLAIIASLCFGSLPAFKYLRPRLSLALRAGGRALSESRERHRARSVLVVVQVALALVLLVGSVLMIRTFQALRSVDPGFSGAQSIQALRLFIPSSQVKDPEAAIRMHESILRKIEALPQVEAATLASSLPMVSSNNDPIYAEDVPLAEGKIPPIRRFKRASPGYLKTIGGRLIAGREFTWNETYGNPAVALVSENLAREYWQDPQRALGKRIRPTPNDAWREVVGVVADLHDDGVDKPAPTIVYWPLVAKKFTNSDVSIQRGLSYIVRSPRAGSARFSEDLRQAVWSVNPNLPLADVQTLEEVYIRSLARTTFTMAMLAISGILAFFLGLIGIYGVISYSVAQRTREIGIRLALGSPTQEVTALFVRHGLLLSSLGVAVGLAAAIALSRALSSLLYSISPYDPLTYAMVALILIAAAVLASYLPARRALRIDPADALRAE